MPKFSRLYFVATLAVYFFSLPLSSVPVWANKMSDEEWNRLVRDRLGAQPRQEAQGSGSHGAPNLDPSPTSTSDELTTGSSGPWKAFEPEAWEIWAPKFVSLLFHSIFCNRFSSISRHCFKRCRILSWNTKFIALTFYFNFILQKGRYGYEKILYKMVATYQMHKVVNSSDTEGWILDGAVS